MKLLDIINLAKAGYKKADIDELLKLEVDEPEPDNNADSPKTENGTGGVPDDSLDDDQQEKPDYEHLYNELKTEMDSLKEQLKSARQDNVHKNLEHDQDPESFNDIFRQFM